MENCNLEKLKGKNWVATLLFCWFLGLYGAHRFYTGKSNSAWVMLILSITGLGTLISMIWALIDGFAIALGKFTHEDGGELYERIDWLGYVYIAMMVIGILGALAYIVIFCGIFAATISSIGSGAGTGVTP